ncbi:AfsR/SARP family transcriptional regulator [Actinophytocola oryzae]|uniref:AfsR/SARP family transcriptional regulator n=1 Tax=Actinophytocola oryzae TaxID=502181 RepID=UPI001063F664|nr:BTAD domain-containing putative transcriptional regulator [Actinophytocola oryzae]
MLTDSASTALDHMETALTTRIRTGEHPGPLALFIRPTQQVDDRLHAVLNAGAEHGLAAVLLGPWSRGNSLHVGDRGVVEAANPTLDVIGTRLYSLSDDDTADLVELLCHVTDAPTPQDVAVEERRPDPDRQPAKPPPKATAAQVDLHVLGRIRLLRNGVDITNAVAPKQREIIVHLALHPDGVRRDAIVADIWPDAPGHRPQNSFHATLSQLRRALRTATDGAVETLTTTHDSHYALDPHIVDVDLWRLHRLLRDPSADAVSVTDLYRGELAEELGAEWLITPRETIRRDVLDSLENAAKNSDITLETRLTTLEDMRRIDPYNEGVYQDIIRIQRELGREESVARTIALLKVALAEIGESPSSETTSLL